MIDLPLYSFTIPLIIVLLTSAFSYQMRDYDRTLSEVELRIKAHQLSDELFSELAESREIVEGEVKTWPNKLSEDLETERVDFQGSYKIMLNNTLLSSKGNLDDRVYSVNRIVWYEGEPVLLRVSVSN